MKKLLYVIVLIIFFLLGLSVFYNNPQSVELKYYMGWQVELPLTVILLITFAAGVVIGYFASLLKSLKLRRRLAKANKMIQTLEKNQI